MSQDSSNTTTNDDGIGATTIWISFSLLILLASLTKYISRLLFAVLSGINQSLRYSRYVQQAESLLKEPLALLLSALLFFSAVLLILNSYVKEVDARGRVIVLTMIGVGCVVALLYFTQRCFRLLLALGRLEVIFQGVHKDFRSAIAEIMGVFGVVLYVFTSLLILEVFVSLVEGSNFNYGLIGWVTQMNVFTASAVLAAAPVLRDMVAGLTLLTDAPFRVGDVIQLPDVTGKAVVTAIRLRLTELQCVDKSVMSIPNGEFLTRLVVNHSSAAAQVIELDIPLRPETGSGSMRSLASALEVLLYNRLDEASETNGMPEWLQLNSTKNTPKPTDIDGTSTQPPAMLLSKRDSGRIGVEDVDEMAWNVVDSLDTSLDHTITRDRHPVTDTGLRRRSSVRVGRHEPITGCQPCHDNSYAHNNNNNNNDNTTINNNNNNNNNTDESPELSASIHSHKVLTADLDSRLNFQSIAEQSAHLFRSAHVSEACYFIIGTDKVLHMRVPFTAHKRLFGSSKDSRDADLVYRFERSTLLLAVTELLEQNSIEVCL